MTASPQGDTIFALSSGAAPAAIGIVRVSGPAAARALERLAGRIPLPRQATYAAIRRADGELIDRALVLWFPGPASATGEDLAEFHLHGGRAVIAGMLAALAELDGCRAAEPGEFTRRAFLNGRIDLTAAEGLADLLSAETSAQHARALRMAEGGLGRIVERWRQTLLDLSARVEAAIEFGETEDDVGELDVSVLSGISDLRGEAGHLLAQPPAERLQDGIRVVIAGPPNSGKSSLINVIAGRDVALATPIAGTTRDVIEAPVRLGDHAVILTDTAGLRETGEEIEKLGIDRARQVLADADLILWCGDAADCPNPGQSILLWTRADDRDGCMADGQVRVSIREPSSIAGLRSAIERRCAEMIGAPDAMLLNQRQRALVDMITAELSGITPHSDLVLVAEHLRLCRVAMDAIVGRSRIEEMLDSLFGRFCIGK